jgi:hypothetical protein
MNAATIRNTTYYRCLARTPAPSSPVLADHPRTVHVREDHVLDRLNDWIGRVYDRDHLDRTVAAILAEQLTAPEITPSATKPESDDERPWHAPIDPPVRPPFDEPVQPPIAEQVRRPFDGPGSF